MTDLSAALALRGPDATLKLYRAWAASYDWGFAAGMDYLLPVQVAGAFVAAGGSGPVLDVGAGTGLLAQALQRQGFQGAVDGLDFSGEMLAVAGTKGVYRRLVQADVTRALPLGRIYNGVTSSGTFTAGHVGPEAFGPMLEVALPGAQFAISVNQRVWLGMGFDLALRALEAGGRIAQVQLIEVEVYGAAAAALDPDHAGDKAWIALFKAV